MKFKLLINWICCCKGILPGAYPCLPPATSFSTCGRPEAFTCLDDENLKAFEDAMAMTFDVGCNKPCF